MTDAELPAEITKWLSMLEARIDKEGWGQARSLWFVSTAAAGRDAHQVDWTTVSFMSRALPGAMATAPVKAVLLELGRHVVDNKQSRDALREMLTDGELCALALADEVWSIPPGDAPAWKGRSWADHPSRKEVRFVDGVDVFGHRYRVERERESGALVTEFSTADLDSAHHRLLEIILQALRLRQG